ncbi:MAG: type II secretion system protein [Candidatus Wallbacteria bacterium]|nr:type II secretion system protein [Candidatus Wallbacteria bacterium]
MNKKAFSFIELVMVMVIISIITAGLIASFEIMFDHARHSRAKAELSRIADLIRDYHNHMDKWPLELTDLPLESLSSTQRFDPWGVPYTILNYKVASVLYAKDGTIQLLNEREQFRFSRLYAFGQNGRGYAGVWLSSTGGESFSLLIDTASLPEPMTNPGFFNNLQYPQLNAGRIFIVNEGDNRLFSFSPENNDLRYSGLMLQSCLISRGIAWFMDSSSRLFFTTDGAVTYQMYKDYGSSPSAPVLYQDACFNNYMLWETDTLEIHSLTTGNRLEQYFPGNFQHFLQGSTEIYGYGSSGLYHLEKNAARNSYIPFGREGINDWKQIQSGSISKAWLFEDLIIVQGSSGEHQYFDNADQQWKDLAELWPGGPSTYGKIVCIYLVGQEYWVTATTGGTSVRLYHSLDSGASWTYCPERHGAASGPFLLGDSDFNTPFIYYRE